MRIRSVRDYIVSEQMKIVFVLLLLIFLFSTLAIYTAVYYQNVQRAEENILFVERAVERFLKPYETQAERYRQDPQIQRYCRDASGDKAAAQTLDLEQGLALFDLERQIYPRTEDLRPVAGGVTDAAALLRETPSSLRCYIPLKEATGTEPIGYLTWVLPESALAEFLEQTIPASVAFALYDQAGGILYDTSVAYRYEEKAAARLKGGVTGVAIVNAEVGYRSVLAYLACLMPIGLFVFVINYWLAKQLSEKLVRPITTLIASIRQNRQGHLNYIDIDGSELEEIETLSQSYRDMMLQLNELMEKNQKENLLRIESQLGVLQEKINPHFLFNTLEFINSQAILEDAGQTAYLIQKLGVLFRYSLRAPDVLPLRQEAAYAKDYLSLQNALRNGLLTCQYDIDAAALEAELPKLILQPLLENCFQHGFRERSDEVCRLRLTIGFENTALCIVVEDDGEGMSQERQRALEQALQSDSESFACFIRRSKHIGLRNVNARLCLHCRVAKAVWVDRSPLGGTRVTLRLPRGGRMAARAPRLTREGGSQAAQGFDCG